MSVSRPPRAEHHVTAFDSALVHFPKMHCREVYLKRTLITKCFQTDVALYPLLPSSGINELRTKVQRES